MVDVLFILPSIEFVAYAKIGVDLCKVVSITSSTPPHTSAKTRAMHDHSITALFGRYIYIRA